MKQIFPTFVILVVTFVLMFTLIPYAFSEVIKWVCENRIIDFLKLNFSRQDELVCGEKISSDKWSMWLWLRNGGRSKNCHHTRRQQPKTSGELPSILLYLLIFPIWFNHRRLLDKEMCPAWIQSRYLRQALYAPCPLPNIDVWKDKLFADLGFWIPPL